MLAAIVGGYLGFALRTTRWRVEGEVRGPVVAALWHECLPLMPALWLHMRRPGVRVHALASRHKDGLFIGAIMRRFGVEMVHGSSTRDGWEGSVPAIAAALNDVAARAEMEIKRKYVLS